MEIKQKSLRRLTVLYVIFFIVIGVSVVLNILSPYARESFNMGVNDAMRMNRAGHDKNIQIFYDIRSTTDNMDFSTPLYGSPDGATAVHGRVSAMDVEIVTADEVKGVWGSMLCAILASLIYIAIFVIIFLILSSMRKSIKKGETLSKSNIILTRSMGIMLIAASLLMSLSSYIESRAMAVYFADSGFGLYSMFPFDFTQIITGVLVFVVAEVFAIDYSIAEEQKLTI